MTHEARSCDQRFGQQSRIGPQKAKVKLAQHIKELVLTPKKRNGKWVYEVTGDWELLPEKKCVILMVARDGIEPPTRGFSVRCSTS